MIKRFLGQFVLALGLTGLVSPAVHAQAFPSKPVRLIIPFPPGGSTDTVGRLLANRLSTTWRQPVIVENRPGAGGNIGADAVSKSAPDGYTFLLIANSHVSSAALYEKLPFDPVKDFTPLSQIAFFSLVLVVHPSLSATTLQQLVALSKSTPTKLIMASAGNGTTTHLVAELYRSASGFDFLHAPYKGGAPATADLLAGHVQMMFLDPISAAPQVRAGKLRALATTGATRSVSFANIPTIAESGFPGFEAVTWFGFVGPPSMPAEIVRKISSDVVAVLQLPDVRTRFGELGIEPLGTSPERLGAVMQTDLDKWSKLIRSANIKAN